MKQKSYEEQAKEKYKYEIGQDVKKAMELYSNWGITQHMRDEIRNHISYLITEHYKMLFYTIIWKKRAEHYKRERDKADYYYDKYFREAHRLLYNKNWGRPQEECVPEDFQGHLVMWMDWEDN